MEIISIYYIRWRSSISFKYNKLNKTLDERTFNQEYMASFVNYAGQIYYNFDRKQNVLDIYNPKTNQIHIGMDFNIDPMSAVISELKGNNIYVYDEIVIYSSNTDEMVQEIKKQI